MPPGTWANPSYKRWVCSGNSRRHAEVVQIHFDPAEVSAEDLLRVFFTIHDPTTKLIGEGHDVEPQCRSIILTHSDAQAQAARAGDQGDHRCEGVAGADRDTDRAADRVL